jgi:site-specific recombinase XerD
MARKLSALKTLSKYIVREEIRNRRFYPALLDQSQHRKLPETLDVVEVEKLIDDTSTRQ